MPFYWWTDRLSNTKPEVVWQQFNMCVKVLFTFVKQWSNFMSLHDLCLAVSALKIYYRCVSPKLEPASTILHRSLWNCTDLFMSKTTGFDVHESKNMCLSELRPREVTVYSCFSHSLHLTSAEGISVFTFRNAETGRVEDRRSVHWLVCPRLRPAGSPDVESYTVHAYLTLSQQCFTKTTNGVYIKCLYKTHHICLQDSSLLKYIPTESSPSGQPLFIVFVLSLHWKLIRCHIFNMQCNACNSQLAAETDLTCVRKTIYLWVGVQKVCHRLFCPVFVFSACEFLFKTVIFIFLLLFFL